MRPEELAKVDIATMNLRCTEGLKGSENLKIEDALTAIDRMAERVKFQTERYWYKFNEHPDDFKNSEPYFRMMMLATVLQQDLGIHYDPALKIDGPPPDDDHFFDDSRNVFLNGILERRMGSCASLPVLYVAVGRRLGYPLKLVPTNSHLYLRWESSRAKFNIEATTDGFVSLPDEYYWKWPIPVTPRAVEKYELFKAFDPSDDLACFLSTRADVLMANDDYEKSLKFLELAEKVSPHSEIYRLKLKTVRPYVENRRGFDARRRTEAQDAEMEAAYQFAISHKNQPFPTQASSGPLGSPSPILPNPQPGVIYSPQGNGFTPPTQAGRMPAP